MRPERVYEYLVAARSRVLGWARSVPEAEHGREFPIGRGTLLRTLTHILASEWYYVERLTRRDVPAYGRWPIREEEPPALAALEAAWGPQADRTRSAVRGVKDWDEPIEYRIVNDAGQPEIITASASDIFTQLVLHEVHHRAQAMNILRRLGVAAEDIDFNTLMYGRRPG